MIITEGACMKRFVVFSWPDYYPGGGMSDVQSCWDTLEDAQLWVFLSVLQLETFGANGYQSISCWRNIDIYDLATCKSAWTGRIEEDWY